MLFMRENISSTPPQNTALQFGKVPFSCYNPNLFHLLVSPENCQSNATMKRSAGTTKSPVIEKMKEKNNKEKMEMRCESLQGNLDQEVKSI